LSVQAAAPGGGSLLTALCVLAWIGLLGLGAWAAFRRIVAKDGFIGRKTLIVIGCALAGQILITMMFGIESFLYSAHFTPLLVCLAALGALTRARWVVVPIAAVLAVAAGFNNLQRFDGAAILLGERGAHERAFTEVLRANTDASALFVCGAASLAGSGESAIPVADQATASIIGVTSRVDPDTCIYTFDDDFVQMRGWRLRYRAWTIESLETLRARGARYFVTQYEYGLEERANFFDALDARYLRMVRTPRWAIYDLQQPGAAGE
jgi:hypothetical protein